MTLDIRRHHTAGETADACGRWILDRLAEARQQNGHASLAISGGSTPKLMFQFWAGAGFDWRQIDLFWVDERPVPPDHEQSNYRLAKETFLDSVKGASIHRIEAEHGAAVAAALYEVELSSIFGQGVPAFDVIHLGLGPDGHTASLFPGLAAVKDTHHTVSSVYVEKMKTDRITLMPSVLRAAKALAMLAAGADKHEPLTRVFAPVGEISETPGRIAPRDKTVYFVDQAAWPE
jgi:6-phosphogluconolactonase